MRISLTSRDFSGRNFDRALTDREHLRADEFRLELWFTVLQEHLDDFPEIIVEFVECFALRVRFWKTRNEPYEQPGIGVSLDDRSEHFHRWKEDSTIVPG